MTGFLKKLQSSDEATKRKWLVGATIVAMVIVLYVWLAYFNNLVVHFSAQHSDESGAIAEKRASGSFFDHIRQGAAGIYQSFTNTMGYLGKILEAPREYIIKPN